MSGDRDASAGTALSRTGDPAIDDVLADLEAVPEDDVDARLQAAEHVHRVLVGRLAEADRH